MNKLFLILLLSIIHSYSSFASMPDGLYGYKLGMPCKKITQTDDKQISFWCTGTTKKIAEIHVSFKTISYEDLLKKTIKTINSEPTKQIPNKKVLGCDMTLLNIAGIETEPDPDKHHFIGYSEWLSVQKTSIKKDPKI